MRIFIICALVAGFSSAAFAQSKPEPKFGIFDNSFLVEEAFNQEAGIFQNILVLSRARHGRWDGSFTQEWPVTSVRHQLSFTLPFGFGNGTGATGDLAFNYRFQLSEEGDGRAAIAPRFSLMAPTSERTWDDGVAWQVNLPVSKRLGAVYLHGNVGSTFEKDATTPFFGGSAIVAVTPMVNLMLETVVESAPGIGGRDVTRIVSPGMRIGWNIGDQQVVAGIAIPVTRGADRDTAVLGYFSYELPFRKPK